MAKRGLLLGAMGAMALIAGCNMITGASDLRIGAEGDGPDTDDGASGPGVGSGGTGAGVEIGGAGEGAGTPAPPDLANADGVSIVALDLYQALRRPIMEDGQPASSDIPIVAGKKGMLRVFYTTEASYDGAPVTARLTVGSAPPLEQTETLSGSSSHQQLGSTINIEVPGEVLTPGAEFKLELLQPAESVSGSHAPAAYPSDGSMAPMDVEPGAVKLKIMLVPVSNNGSLPDTSTEQVQRYHTYFSEQYPVPEVEITVRQSAYTFNSSLGSYNGWSNLLDQITQLRQSDNAPEDVYYYGIHNANGNGLLGLGWIGGSNDVWSRTAIGVGWTGDTAPETAVHELGHNHGRGHSPCGVSGDSSYPHPGARIGVWGYRPSTKELLDPNDYVDFMSYCSPAWISDWNFKHIFQRAKQVSTQPYLQIPPDLLNRSYERIKVIEGQASFQDAITLARPPVGKPVAITVTSSQGTTTEVASYYAYNHIDGGVLLVLRPQGHVGDYVGHIHFQAEGQAFSLSR